MKVQFVVNRKEAIKSIWMKCNHDNHLSVFVQTVSTITVRKMIHEVGPSKAGLLLL
jgi:hypothetical protein